MEASGRMIYILYAGEWAVVHAGRSYVTNDTLTIWRSICDGDARRDEPNLSNRLDLDGADGSDYMTCSGRTCL